MTSLAALRRKATACTACPLYRDATQTVFGEGDAHASIVLVGEQPGNEEDLAGRPFAGPAGRLPSALLRIPDPDERKDAEQRFVADLREAARVAHHAIRAREEETTG